MQYTIFKLGFKAPVHFGSGTLSKSVNTIMADTLFSAMYKEAIKLYGEKETDKLRKFALDGDFSISDCMPYFNDTLYVPKPVVIVDGADERESNSSMKKKFKKLSYIPVCDLNKYLSGNYDPSAVNNEMKSLGVSDVSAKVAVKVGEDSEPYNVGTFKFNTDGGYGLYFICGGSDEAFDMIYEIMDSLSYTGIGGKISAGYGRFDYTYNDISDDFKKALTGEHKRYMSLSVSMAENEEETEKAVDDAYFEIVKRSGFVSSENYADNQLKKRDFYCFKGGSCFKNKFRGSIFDVSDGGRHPVYRYAMPMFFGID